MSAVALSEVVPIGEILRKDPRQAWSDQADIGRQWRALGYTEEPDFARACAEFDAFAGILRRFVLKLHFLPAHPGTGLDSIYVRDAACLAPRGFVLCQMGKALRRGEPAAVKEFCRSAE